MNTVILANGDFPSHPIPLRLLCESDLIICCDGAVNKLATHLMVDKSFANALQGDAPHRQGNPITVVVVGDGDSFHPNTSIDQLFAEAGSPLLRYSDEDQETNDLTKAIRYAANQGVRNIDIVGATGLREDHTLGNISLLAHHSDLYYLRLFTDYGSFTPIQSTTRFKSFARQQVSIFNLRSNAATLSSKGLQYPFFDRSFEQWWEGTLNASLGDEFTIEVNALPGSNIPPHVLVYRTYDAKE